MGSIEGIQGAASLAFAMIRFQEPVTHPDLGWVPPNRPHVGVDAYVFAPGGATIPRDEVVSYLTCLDSPAMMYQTTARGVIALYLLKELSGTRRASAEHALRNQQAALAHMAEAIGLSAKSLILLQFDEEEHVFGLETVRIWAERFAVHVGWSMGPLLNDRLASARLHLIRGDGGTSWGRACPFEPKP